VTEPAGRHGRAAATSHSVGVVFLIIVGRLGLGTVRLAGCMTDRSGGVPEVLHRRVVGAGEDGIPRLLDQVREQVLAQTLGLFLPAHRSAI
jgi:hypothetical protein